MSGAAQRVEKVLQGLPATRSWQEDFYRDLHEHPELSHHEHRTAGLIAQRLTDMGYDVHSHVGGTGVVGILKSGDGPTVLLRADIDALPVQEATGLPYASSVRNTDDAGNDVPVMHACGHDVHATCLLGAAELLAGAREQWNGTLITLFQPAEEIGDGAKAMVDDNLAALIPHPDVALAQHVFPMAAGYVGVRSGATLAAADNLRITVYGRGGHGSMPQTTIDPVVLAAMIVVRLQTIVAREIAPIDTVALTVGSIHGGEKCNVISDHAVLELTLRTYDDDVRTHVLAAIKRIVAAECAASGSPKEPQFETIGHYPVTINDAAVTQRVEEAFADFFGDRSQPLPLQTGSEDFSDIPTSLGVPYTYWGFGGTDPGKFHAAVAADQVSRDIPMNHSPGFAPVVQPTLDTGTQALIVAALAWL